MRTGMRLPESVFTKERGGRVHPAVTKRTIAALKPGMIAFPGRIAAWALPPSIGNWM
jgi:hypothetical protein